jgi:hypothetical protein
MPNYALGKIYCISSPNHEKCYIGSTAHPYLSQRWALHNYQARLKKIYCSSMPIIWSGDAKIELLEEYPCECSQELRKREDYWISQFDNTINKNRSYVSREEVKRMGREKQRWLYNNDPEFRAKKRQYYHDNKEICKERVRRSQAKRKERELQQAKEALEN